MAKTEPRIPALKQAVDDAYTAEEELLEERRANRESLSKSAFRAYNEETRQRQIDVQKAISAAERQLQLALNNARQELLVGTVAESNTGGGANG